MNKEFLIKTEVKPSTIENGGNARYFMENVKKGTVIRKQKVDSESLQVFNNEKDLENVDITILKHYAYPVPEDCLFHSNKVFLNNPFMYCNHSNDPNIKDEYTDTHKYTITTRDVVEGEEMFINYGDFKKIEWFENYLDKNNVIGVRQFAKMC